MTSKNLPVHLTDPPILYSFRRCPYAMRARLALLSAKIPVVLREVSLKNKPQELIALSKKKTVPCLQTKTKIISESLDIMCWALLQNDPEDLLDVSKADWDLIDYNDGPFKSCLDRTKYKSRFDDVQIEVERKRASEFMDLLNRKLITKFVLGENKSIVDLAILPFIRQYAFIDKLWFEQQGWDNLNRWLAQFLNSTQFSTIQQKYTVWKVGDYPEHFPR